MSILQFQPFSSAVNVSFWYELGKLKLDRFKLAEEPIPINGYYTTGIHSGIPSFINLERDAFFTPFTPPPRSYMVQGTLFNTNTLETFKGLPKPKLFSDLAEKIWEDIKSGAAVQDPSLLNRFLLLTFADLKSYKYYYMFGFPALSFEDAIVSEGNPVPLSEEFTPEELASFRLPGIDQLPQYFLVKRDESRKVVLGHISEWESFTKDNKSVMLGFADSSGLDSNPGWSLRNVLALLSAKWKVTGELAVICYKEGRSSASNNASPSVSGPHGSIIKVKLPEKFLDINGDCPKVVGWERDSAQKIAPRYVDLGSTMDPNKLAISSVDLNLKLMRWRILPDLDLDKVANTKCLLIGAGTLGCNVARCLLSWGVRTITFVDCTKVSFSNPVRQTLYEFKDCLDGGRPKAIAAAGKLKEIFPAVNSEGHHIFIPMPGHQVTPSEVSTVQETVNKLDSLIQSHDAVFLLTDSRESRWLPTVLCTAQNKLVINAALGFDTYLVMRHGSSDQTVKPRLGCYFCNDVVVPQDSLKDRTLDQQCTVTRPGLSFLASSLAVELMTSVLQHPMVLFDFIFLSFLLYSLSQFLPSPKYEQTLFLHWRKNKLRFSHSYSFPSFLLLFDTIFSQLNF
eukprot:TRINITY_DN3239_c0_g2_i5.p1 TRINITY_DN3239_c0_g2~~TRINITY_DN3239_c0_g2_i5.p1  ORF type:complete len:623 (+),score=106.10 TRINITY_DN3239_c0_g2_i5:111-1979(+)